MDPKKTDASVAKNQPKVPKGEAKAYSVSSRDNDAWNVRIPKLKMPRRPGFTYDARHKPVIAAVLLLLVLGFGFLGGWLGAHVGGDDGQMNSIKASQKIVTSQSQLISEIAKMVGPSVVSVDVLGTSTTSTGNPYFDAFYGGGSQQTESAGTGIILNKDGLILTNRHVVPAGTTSVSITLSDGTKLDNVEVLGRTSDSESLDVAFLKVTDAKGHKLVPATIGNSSNVQVGDAVVAIGNALGQFQNTVTSGIISGFGRSVQAGDASGYSSATENLDDLFQTDAAINEGNSGGPLVNMNGQVIGINTAIASNSQNVGFAIPIDDVTGLISQVEANGKFERPYLGVRYAPLTADVAKQYDLSVQNGAFILPTVDAASPSVIQDSPADKAGIQAGDIITKVDNTSINQTTSLTSLLSKHKVGDTVTLTIVRDGKTITKDVTLGAAPNSQ